jgi:ABC-type nitrate/sulfonate/bicarbonate transport system permease component
LINPVLLPSPTTLFWASGDLVRSGTLVRHVIASIERVLIGFALAALVGLLFGVVLGWFRTLSDFVKPLVEALRPIPPIAWTPLAILWFGVGNAPSYFLVFVGAVFPVFVSTFSAVRNIERTQISDPEAGEDYRAGLPGPGYPESTWAGVAPRQRAALPLNS